MKVAIVTPDFPPIGVGGCAVSSGLLADQLRSRGIQTDVFCFGNAANKEGRHPHGTNTYFRGVPLFHLANTAIIFFRLFSKLRKYDVIHVFNVSPLPAVLFLKRLRRTKARVVSTLNNLNGVCPDPVAFFKNGCKPISFGEAVSHAFRNKSIRFGAFGRLANLLDYLFVSRFSKGADCHAAQTRAMKSYYEDSGFRAEDIVVIPNMIDPAFLAEPRSPAAETSPVTILFSGQLASKKGPLEALDAYASLPSRLRKRSVLRIVGKGKLESVLRERIATSGLADNVELFHATYDEQPRVFREADIFLHPAKWPEPFSRTWLEAMGSGLAIVSSDNPSAREAFGDAATFSVPFDVESLRDAMIGLLENDTLRKDMAARARKRANDFLPEYVVNAFLERAYAPSVS